MKYSNIHTGERAGRKPPCEKPSWTRRIAKIATSVALATSLSFSPMAEGIARAENPSKEVQTEPTHRVIGTTGELTDGTNTPTVYVLSRQARQLPVVEVDGPARLTIRFYPTLNRSRFDESPEISRPISYTIAEVGGETIPHDYPGVFRISNFTSPNIAGSDLVIGTPVEITITLLSGSYRVGVTAPNGFLEVVHVEREHVPTPPPRPVQPPVAAPTPAVQEEPEQPESDSPRPNYRPVVQLTGERAGLHEVGPFSNSGDMNSVLLTGDIPLGDHFSVVVGGSFLSNGLTMEQPEAVTSLRSLSGALGAGLRYRNGSHSLYALALGGYRAIMTDVESTADAGTFEETVHAFGYAGQLGYSFDQWFALTFEGGNDPFNPISARVYGALPYGWVRHAYPWAELDLRWLHTMRPLEQDGLIGAANLDDDVFHGRLLLGVPLVRLGPVVPSALVAGDLNASAGGLHSADFMLGGALGLDFLEERLRIEAGGAVSPLTVTPMFLLRASYSQ
jgi:hypothetical protein